MKTTLLSILLTSMLCACSSAQKAPVSPSAHITVSSPATPSESLSALIEGNKRFMEGREINHDFHYQIENTKDGQTPHAVVLSCLDSRVPVEVVFNQGIGDIFVARVAGNIENNDILGSMEFGTAAAGAKLIVVMGHTKCGAVKGACQQFKLGHLTGLLDKIQPAVKKVKRSTPDFDPTSYDHVDHVSEENVRLTLARIRKNSKIIRDLETQKKLRLVGAMYDISSGGVRFLD